MSPTAPPLPRMSISATVDEVISVTSSTDLSIGSTDSVARGATTNVPYTGMNTISREKFAVEDVYQNVARSPDSYSPSMERSPTPTILDQKRVNLSSKSSLLHAVKLPKKPSFPLSFTPSFLQTNAPDPTPNFQSSSEINENPHNHSLHSIPVPSLLDDDPFANLTLSNPNPTSSQFPLHSVSLSESLRPSTVVLSPRVYVPPATRPKSSGHGQVRPAHTRPAIVPRPSLPSLHTLAQMNVVIPRKVRRGTVGAHLPHEPWNMGFTAEPDLHVHSDPFSADPSQNHSRNATNSSQSQQTNRNEDFIFPPNDTSGGLVSSSGTGFTFSDERSNTSVQAADEITSTRPRSLSMHDADSVPSLSYTTSGPSSSTLSRSSAEASSPCLEFSMNEDDNANTRSQDSNVSDTRYPSDCPASDVGDDDLLSYHSDFDYYTRSHSDLSDFEPDASEPQMGRWSPRSSDVGITPHTSLYSPRAEFEPGTSGDAMKRVLCDGARANDHLTPPPRKGDALQDRFEKHDLNDAAGRHGRQGGRRGHEGGHMSSRFSSELDGEVDSDEGGEGRRRKVRSSISAARSSSSDDGDGNTVYYSVDGTSNGPSSRAQSRHSKAGGGSDDDIPLAQRMPTALTAQKSIRKQLRDERHQRKLERAKSTRAAPPPPLPVEPPLPASVSRRPTHIARQRSMSAAPARASDPLRRERSHPRPAPVEAFPAEDLTRKLTNLQITSPSPITIPSYHDAPSSAFLSAGILPGSAPRSPSRGQPMAQVIYKQQVAPRPPEASQDKSLRSMRSFHRPEGRHAESQGKPVEASSAQRLGRSMTTGARRSIEPSGSSDVRSARNCGESASFASRERLVKSGRVSEDGRRPSASASRTSVDRENDVAGQRVAQRPPVPPIPPSETILTQPQHPPPVRDPVVQQRIFIGDMQRFNMVEIASGTNAGNVIDIVASQGLLDRSGSWMLFELAQDFGMERPIRDYELLADVSASWNKDKLLNAFVIKSTPLARILSPSAIPTSSPTHRGWVEWESKRGKWSRRWMELREHSLWLSKRDTGKDEVFLCSLSNFDAYYVTRRHKSPKTFVFAIKSTDNLSLFENAADYLHVFSCNPKDGEKWIEAISVARSYVLYQERHVLFAKAGDVSRQGKPLARTQTRKQSTATRPTQPLISVPPPFNASAPATFEPGSLLAKRT